MPEEVLPCESLEALLEAEVVPAIGMWSVKILAQAVEAEGEGRVRARLQLPQEQATLSLDFLGQQGGLQGNLGDHRQERLPVTPKRLPPEFGRLDFAAPVEAAPDVFRRLGQLHERPFGGAAEQHALQEIRDPGGLECLEVRPGPHLQRYGDHVDRRVLAHEHDDPV